jgi:Ni,Fe-hydrogenase III small subunit
LATGIVTTDYPLSAPAVSSPARGRPEIDFANWRDARPATEICPTGALTYTDRSQIREATLDLGKCTFCGLCADVDPAIRMTSDCELAVNCRQRLKVTARYQLAADGTHQRLLDAPDFPSSAPLEPVGKRLKSELFRALGRSLHIREVDAGSCNGCEVEITGLNSPIYDLERFGIHFVASPRHADMMLVTGPVTRNMELALVKTYDAMPEPRLVVAVGACGCSGGIFGQNYATCGGVNEVIPVDAYIPGCPPNPHALLHGILVAVGRLKEKWPAGAAAVPAV